MTESTHSGRAAAEVTIEMLEQRCLLAVAPIGPLAANVPVLTAQRAAPARDAPADLTGRYIARRQVFEVDNRRIRRNVRLTIDAENAQGAFVGTLSISRVGRFDVSGTIQGVAVNAVAIGPDGALNLDGRIRARGRFITGQLNGQADGRSVSASLRVGRKATGAGITDFIAAPVNGPFVGGFGGLGTQRPTGTLTRPTDQIFNDQQPIFGSAQTPLFDNTSALARQPITFPTSTTPFNASATPFNASPFTPLAPLI